MRRSRYRLYRKHRSAIETALLKLLTDVSLLANSTVWLLRVMMRRDRRSVASTVMRCNMKIIRLNPFVLKVP